MRFIEWKTVERLTKQLIEKGDISEKDAEKIARPFLRESRDIALDRSLRYTLYLWYDEVEKKLPEYGNYVTSVPLKYGYPCLTINYKSIDKLYEKIRMCAKKMSLSDRIEKMQIFVGSDKKTICGKDEDYYVYNWDKRAGMLHDPDLEKSLESLSLIMEGERAKSVFLYQSPKPERVSLQGILGAIVASFVDKMHIPNVYIELFPDEYLFYISPEYKHLLNPVLAIPEELILESIKRGKFLDEKELEIFLKYEFKYIDDFPIKSFIESFNKTLYNAMITGETWEDFEDEWLEMDR